MTAVRTVALEPATFGQTLRRLREQTPGQANGNRFGRSQKHLSQTELAKRAGVDVSYLSLLERGKKPPPSRYVVSAIADALELAWGDYDALMRSAGYLPEQQSPVVSEVMPAGHAFAAWIQSGGDPAAAPFVAFAAGYMARDGEIEALREALEELTDCWHDTIHGVEESVEAMRACRKSVCATYRDLLAARRTAGGSGDGE